MASIVGIGTELGISLAVRIEAHSPHIGLTSPTRRREGNWNNLADVFSGLVILQVVVVRQVATVTFLRDKVVVARSWQLATPQGTSLP